MRSWGAGLVAGLAIVLLAHGLAGASDDPASTVQAEPSPGDAARYEGYHHVTNDGETRENTSLVLTRTWERSPVTLPDSTVVELPTLDRDYPPHREPEPGPLPAPVPLPGDALPISNQSVNRTVADLATHYTKLPGPPTIVQYAQRNHRAGAADTLTNVTSLTEAGCADDYAAVTAGRGPAQAQRAVRECLEALRWLAVEAVHVETGWSNHSEYGRTWLLEAHVEATSVLGNPTTVDLTLRTSPEVSQPVVRELVWSREEDGRTKTETQRLEMANWRDGNGTFDQPEPLPDQPTIGEAPWPASAREGLAMGIGEAREQLSQHPIAQRYHDQHPRASLFMAYYYRHHADERSSPSTTSANPYDCRTTQSQEEPLPRGPVEETGWTFFWTDSDAGLYGGVRAPKASQSLPMDGPAPERRALQIPDTGKLPGLGLPRRAPSVSELFDQLDLADRHGFQGDPYAGLQLHLPPRSNDPGVDAVVGRSECVFTGVGYQQRQSALVFHDGRARAVFDFTVGPEHEPLAQGVTESPPAHEPDGGPEDLGPVAVAGSAIAIGTIVGMATSALPGLYSRFTSRDVLENDVRAELMDRIRHRPGVHLSELAEDSSLHRSTVKHHLEMLDRHGHVELPATASGVVAYPPGHPGLEHAELLARSQARDVLATLAEAPGLSISDLADHLDVSKGYVSPLVADLAEAGLVERERTGRELAVSLTDRGQRLLPRE